MVSAVSMILAISPVSYVDFPAILLLLHRAHATRLKKSRLGFESLNAYISDCEQIGHHSWLIHGVLLHSLDVADSITEGINDLDVLDIWDSVPSVAEMFNVVTEAFIILLLDGTHMLEAATKPHTPL
jgi:hypothetical protein